MGAELLKVRLTAGSSFNYKNDRTFCSTSVMESIVHIFTGRNRLNFRRVLAFICLIPFIPLVSAQLVRYSPAWFGPNANPVPEFTDATIPSNTSLSLMGDYYFGFGDKTINGYLKVEVPLLPGCVSMKVWTSVLEYYRVTPEVSAARRMAEGSTSGTAGGDIYVQTRIRILSEQKNVVNIILNSTLKTASGTKFQQRRYFDTPGYYFDVEAARSFPLPGRIISEIRCVANLGALFWETTGSTQNDAPLYGIKIIAGNSKWKLENSLSGYWGWMHSHPDYGEDYGDTPLVFASKLVLLSDPLTCFVQYQYGIKDFPYHQIRLGTTFRLEKLTPKY